MGKSLDPCSGPSTPSKGQAEPYTLAMVLSECLHGREGARLAILTTDVSMKVLEKASRGIYAESKTASVPSALRRKYLLQSNKPERLVRIVPNLREKISFHALNLMSPDYRIKDSFDIIFLRNVLIYFDRPRKRW